MTQNVATYDFDVVRGDVVPVRFVLKTRDAEDVETPLDMSADDVLLEIRTYPAISLLKSEDELTGDFAEGEVIWTPTRAQTRSISRSGSTYYLQRRVDGGEWRTYLTGKITGLRGPND